MNEAELDELPSFLNDDEKNYIQTRVNNQINWYDSSSLKAQKYYRLLSLTTLIVSAIIPFFTNLAIDNFWIKLIVSLLGVIATLCQGILSLNKYNENWIGYRTVCETLKKEKYMFLTKAGVYGESNSSFSFFTERIESVISQENVNWASLNKSNK
ncbi:DUF4231 domain-containing protein [Enterococcus diestrammenae]|uniref:DUF4231 domain-containing protein n=1 Tax=Enterococcus diestrammenae TaxID=1155073 RepID=A0ABV0F630_9ENTE|nr:DUF4231 domain-containing protein [Enterococcus diestrammenae]KAF1296558.1 hypothetical protein BAU18_12190 [Enterococcus diestrammenae]